MEINAVPYSSFVGHFQIQSFFVRLAVLLLIAVAALTGLAIGFERSAASPASISSQMGQNKVDGSNKPAYLGARQDNGRKPQVTAANGTAMLIDEDLGGTSFLPLKTSLPVFKAFDISFDRRLLLYSPLKNGRPSGTLLLEDLRNGVGKRVTNQIVLSASMSPVNSNKIAYTLAGERGFGLGIADVETGDDAVIVGHDVFAEIVEWNDDGRSV